MVNADWFQHFEIESRYQHSAPSSINTFVRKYSPAGIPRNSVISTVGIEEL